MLLFYFSVLHHPRPLDSSNEYKPVAQVLENVLTCSFTALPSTVLKDHDALGKVSLFKPYSFCLREHKLLERCIYILQILCEQKLYRALKTVRSTMESVESILVSGKIPLAEVKVIHLTRDPRGQFRSLMSSTGVLKGANAKIHCKQICERTAKDVVIREKLQRLYPGTILGIHYETLAQKPVETANQIYQFIQGSDAPQIVQKWLKRNTLSNSSDIKEKQYGTQRKDSGATANAWKKALPRGIIKDIDSVCSDYYQISGLYKKFDHNNSVKRKLIN